MKNVGGMRRGYRGSQEDIVFMHLSCGGGLVSSRCGEKYTCLKGVFEIKEELLVFEGNSGVKIVKIFCHMSFP